MCLKRAIEIKKQVDIIKVYKYKKETRKGKNYETTKKANCNNYFT